MGKLATLPHPVEASIDTLLSRRQALEKRLEEIPKEIVDIQIQIDALTKPDWGDVQLSSRQREVLYWIHFETGMGTGVMSNKDIASKLNVTERTIKFHVAMLLVKFQKRDRRGLRDMKRMIALLGMLFFLAPFAHAQQGPPSVTVTWTGVTVPTSAALTYKLERGTAAAGPFTQIANPSTTQVTDTAVVRGQTYFYRVKGSCPTSGAGCGTTAMPINGDSGYSNTASGTVPNASTPPPTPTNLTIVSVQ